MTRARRRSRPLHAALALPLLATALFALSACSQSDAPVEEVEQLVEDVIETPAAQAAAAGPYAPRDECSELDGAPQFLALLRAAVETRDTDVLVALAAQDVKLGFGGDDGAANLRRALDDPAGGLWADLDEVLALGCAANEQGGLTLPWYFDQQIEGDPFETMIVTGENVLMHQAADEASPRVAELSWQAVQLVPDEQGGVVSFGGPDDPWRHVRAPLADGQQADGYVRGDKLRSIVDYRLIATSRNGRWRIIALLAGD